MAIDSSAMLSKLKYLNAFKFLSTSFQFSLTLNAKSLNSGAKTEISLIHHLEENFVSSGELVYVVNELVDVKQLSVQVYLL